MDDDHEVNIPCDISQQFHLSLGANVGVAERQ